MISVIIPVSSKEKYLGDCIDAFNAQTYTDFELIVVTDHLSEKALGELKAQFEGDKVKFFASVEKGVAAARNEGIRHAQGEFIYFCDADDFIREETLQALVEVQEEADRDVVQGRLKRTYVGRTMVLINRAKRLEEDKDEEDENENLDADSDGDTENDLENDSELSEDGALGEVVLSRKEMLEANQELYMNLYLIKKKKRISKISALNTLFRRSIIIDNNILFDEKLKYYSDALFIVKVINHISKFGYVKRAVCYKRVHNDPINNPSLSQTKDENRILEYLTVFKECTDCSECQYTRNLLRNMFVKYYVSNFAIKLKRAPEKVSSPEIRDTVRDILLSFDDEAYKKMKRRKRKLCRLGSRGDFETVRKKITRRLAVKKVKKVLKSSTTMARAFYEHVYLKKPIRENYIMFESFFGKSYSDSPKAIYEYILKNYPNKYKCIWVLDDTSKKLPGNPIKVKRYSRKYAYYLAISKYLVLNMRQPEWVVPDRNVILETWHGIPIKRLMFDQDEVTGPNHRYKQQVYNETRHWNYLISPNPYCTEIYQSCFMFDRNKIIETGYPRNDLLHGFNEEKVVSLKKKIGVPLDKKVIIYAPTFRDNECYKIGAYKYNDMLDFDLLKKNLGDEYVILMRAHYIIADNMDVAKYNGFVIDVSKYDDIMELYLVSDMLITDYSSVTFDFANLRKPMLYFTYDLEMYRDNLRGFYIDIEKELPGPLLMTNEEVLNAIQNIDEISRKYADRYEEFYNRFCPLEDGHSSERVYNAVFKK